MTERNDALRFLNTLTVYLAGAITYTEPEWRESFAKKLEKVGEEYSVKISVYIPLEAKEEPPQAIISRDLEAIQKVDFLISFIFCPTYGTPIEMFYCYSILRKPVFCLCTLRDVSPWITGHSTKLYKTEKGFLNFLGEWLRENCKVKE
jgi:hypothetical protein